MATSESEHLLPASWNDIPDVPLIVIYMQVSDRDRLNMACSCKNWYRMFSSSQLWRERRVVFNFLTAEQTCERELKFLDKFGHCLVKLTLSFGQPTFKSCMTISKAADAYVKKMNSKNNIHLLEINFEPLHMEQHWHFILSRNRLVSALCRMLRKQKFIECTYFAGARMRIHDGCRILEALGKGPKSLSIKTFHMEDFFETNVFPFRQSRYVSAISKFRKLRHLHINYKYISDIVLRNMANALSNSLESLSLVLEGDLRGIEISSDAWYDFSERCPLAKIGVYLCTSIIRGSDLRPPFVRGMPINECYMTSWVRLDDTEDRLANLLHHLGHLYGNTLENFAMFFEHHERIDEELLYLLERCCHLKDLCLQCRINVDTVISIMRLQHRGRFSLLSINLTITGLSEQDWQRIESERVQLLAGVTDFVHVGPNEFGSSIGGSTVTANEDDLDNNDDVDDDDDSADDDIFRMNFNNNDEEVVDISDDEADVFVPPILRRAAGHVGHEDMGDGEGEEEDERNEEGEEDEEQENEDDDWLL